VHSKSVKTQAYFTDNSKVLYFKESMDNMCDLFKIGYRQDYDYLYGHPIALYGNLQLPPLAMAKSTCGMRPYRIARIPLDRLDDFQKEKKLVMDALKFLGLFAKFERFLYHLKMLQKQVRFTSRFGHIKYNT